MGEEKRNEKEESAAYTSPCCQRSGHDESRILRRRCPKVAEVNSLHIADVTWGWK